MPPRQARWLARWRTRTPLRITLVVALLVLVTSALVLSGVAATATLRGYLLQRVDAQLGAAAHEIAEHGLGEQGLGNPPPADGSEDHDGDRERGPLPSQYVVQVVSDDGRVVIGPTSNLVSGEPLPRLPTTLSSTSTDDDAEPFTVEAVSGGGQWRVVGEPVSLSDGSSGTLLVAQSLGELNSTVGRLVLLLTAIGALTILVLAGVGYLLVRASLRPLVEVEHTAAAIAAGDLSQRVPEADPGTEVGQLSAAFNGMLTQIESAFAERTASETEARESEERMRRFVADASHELRTPLTSIRGFAELYRQGAASEPGEVRRLLRRIEDEATRMGLLVEDLLLLARLDQQRPLEMTPVDVLAVATDAVEGARAVQPRRNIQLVIGSVDPPPVVIGDQARLRQVVDNLLGNALRHTPVTADVMVRIATLTEGAAPHVLLEVADEGAGMSAEDAALVFGRFYRADASRSRTDGGTGLGLAIVASLVAGHGGTVDVQTAPGQGARFMVRLPLHGAAGQGPNTHPNAGPDPRLAIQREWPRRV